MSSTHVPHNNPALQEISFAFCKTFATATMKTERWGSFIKVVTKSVEYASKEASIRRSAIVGGLLKDASAGRAENVDRRSILTIDWDDLGETDLDDIEFMLDLALGDVAYVAYSTFRHTPDQPRIRVMVPLSESVSEAEHTALVDYIVERCGLGKPDDCSYVMGQIMFLASHQGGVEPWSMSNLAPFLAPSDILGSITVANTDEASTDLDLAIAMQPLDLTDDQVAALLEKYPASDLDYDGWYRVGMALYHQYQGKDAGLRMWLEWSARDADRFEGPKMKPKWKSFGGDRLRPITMASIIKAAGGLSVEVGPELATTLQEDAEAVSDMKSYQAFKSRVKAMNAMQMPPDVRSMLASVVHEVFAKGAGMGLREVKASFKPGKVGTSGGNGSETGSIDVPAWLGDWVYDENNCLFVNREIASYGIKREAFCAKYNRTAECKANEMDAARFAIDIVHIPTVAQTLYWPGMDRLFTANGRHCLNTYFKSGVEILPKGGLAGDADGQGVVDLFLRHVAFLIESEREQNIFLDWLSFVYQNPGKRVHWAMLLWGIEGNGKSYFFKLMQTLMGENTKPITTSMIESRFNDWAVGSVLSCIEEIRISGTNKWAILDTVKPMLTNDIIGVEPKGRAGYSAPNNASYLMLTNHQDAIPVSNNERRYCVIFTRQRSEDDLFDELGGRSGVSAYFKKLFSETERRADAIGRWLMDRAQGDNFDAGGRAPDTDGLAEMREANVSEDADIVREAIEDFACDVVTKTLIDVTYLNECVMIEGEADLPKTKRLSQILRDKGYTPIGVRYIYIEKKKRYIWTRSNKVSDEEVKVIVRKFHMKTNKSNDPPF